MTESEQEKREDHHTKVTLFERENGEPVFKLGEHGDQFRLADGDLEQIRVVEVADLDEPWTVEQLQDVEENEDLPQPIYEHFSGELT